MLILNGLIDLDIVKTRVDLFNCDLLSMPNVLGFFQLVKKKARQAKIIQQATALNGDWSKQLP